MKSVLVAVAGVTAGVAFTVGTATGGRSPVTAPVAPTPLVTWKNAHAGDHPSYGRPGARGVSSAALNAVVQRYCESCHNPTQKKGNLNLAGFDLDAAPANLQ